MNDRAMFCFFYWSFYVFKYNLILLEVTSYRLNIFPLARSGNYEILTREHFQYIYIYIYSW